MTDHNETTVEAVKAEIRACIEAGDIPAFDPTGLATVYEDVIARAALAAIPEAELVEWPGVERIRRRAQNFLDANGKRTAGDRLATDILAILDDSTDLTPTREGRLDAMLRCTGAGDCDSAHHNHGCFADTGNCEWPSDHPTPDVIPEPATVGGVTREQVARAFFAGYHDEDIWDHYADEGDVGPRYNALKGADAVLALFPAPQTVAGVTAKDIEPILNTLTLEWSNGPHFSHMKRATERILALFPPAPSTVGTVEELRALPKFTALMLRNEMLVWSHEIADYDDLWLPQALPATILTPATTRDVGAVTDAQIDKAFYAWWPLNEAHGTNALDARLGFFEGYRAASAKGDGK